METMYVYLITNLKEKKSYVGSRIVKGSPEEDNYMGSSKELKIDIQRLGNENFTKKIISRAKNIEELWEQECKGVIEYNSMWPNGYNLNKPFPRNKSYGRKHSEETKRKISESTKRTKQAQGKAFQQELIKKGLKTKAEWSEERKAEYSKKLSEQRLGFKHSEETKRKISQSEKRTKSALKKALF